MLTHSTEVATGQPLPAAEQEFLEGKGRMFVLTWLRTLRRTLSTTPQIVIVWPEPAHDTGWMTYRCFLPDLTGFVTTCCMAADQGQPLGHGAMDPQKGIQPRISGFRATGHR